MARLYMGRSKDFDETPHCQLSWQSLLVMQTDGYYAYMAKILEAILDAFIERIQRETKQIP